MTKYRRSGHWRTNSNGTTFWVSDHDVRRDDWNRQQDSLFAPVPPAPPLGIWPRHATLDSFTIPNARCPVCGAFVFFYRSPHSGRVFFDELGPPWPKHACTDDGSTPDASAGDSQDAPPQCDAWVNDGWQPFVVSTQAKGEAAVYLSGSDLWSGKFLRLAVDGAPNADGPLFYRVVDDDGRAEIQWLRAAADCDDGPAWAAADAWIGPANDDELSAFKGALAGDPEAMNAVAWRRSFFYDQESIRKHGFFPHLCDWPFALRWFTRAAGLGNWDAMNNLGVVHLHGYGVKQDAEEAFRLFSAAAEASLDPVPLRHLADCHRDDIGTPRDLVTAAELYELADAQMEQQVCATSVSP